MNLLARKLAHILAENADDAFYEDEIRYGLEIVLGGLIQIVIIMAIALLLGMGEEVLAIITSTALFRRYSGGPHCQAYYRCTITSLITFIVLAYISSHIPTIYLPVYMAGVSILVILVIHYYVPVDNPINPITDESIKRKRKQKSFWVVVLVLLVTIITAYIMGKKLIAIALLLGLFYQNITLLPWGSAYIYLWDRFFDKLETKIKRKEAIKC